MKINVLTPGLCLVLGLVFLTHSTASAGTFKRITIDGSFADWAGVPPAAADDEGDAIAGFDLREIYVANDDQYLYFMVKVFPASTNANYSEFHHHFYIDSDNDPSTGFGGAEMAVEDGYAFSQRYGVNWSDGAVTGLDSAQAPRGELPAYQYEYRVSRAVRDTQAADVPAGSGNPERDLPVFTQDAIGIRWDVLTRSWGAQDAGPAFTYEMAAVPPTFSGTKTLLGLTSAAWRVSDAGTDLGRDWLAADYDDSQAEWKAGTALFGFNAPAGVYPGPVNTALTAGRSTYYLRTHFTWDFDTKGAGYLVSNYLSAGAVFYLNGNEVQRTHLPDGVVSYSTRATGGPAQAGAAEFFDLPAEVVMAGDNVLEVEVHSLPEPGATSLVFGLSLTASDGFPPRIQDPTQPADRVVVEGNATSFSAGVVGGGGPFSYQWWKDGVLLIDATNAILTLDPVLQTDGGSYLVEIASSKGVKVTSRGAILTTTAVPVALSDPSQPADGFAAEGSAVTFAVTATGSMPTYQWFQDDAPIDGASSPQLTLTNLALTDSGKRFSVTVSNRVNTVTSRKAVLTVVNDATPPSILSANGGGRRIRVTFSEPVDSLSSQQPANYSLDGGVPVQSAELDSANPNAVTLTTGTQTFGQAYQLSINGVKDLYGNDAHAVVRFRSTILIDGEFDDWSGVPVVLTQDQNNPGTVEFKDLAVANDADYVYVRFSFHEPAGPLASSNWSALAQYIQIVFDNDADPATGGWNGGEVMNEVSSLSRLGGDWTDGAYLGGDTALAPAEVASTNFEFRISLRATHERDHRPAFANSTINVFCAIRDTSWSQIDITDYNPPVSYTIIEVPPLNVTITAKIVGNKLELTWPGGGVLETRATLSSGAWTAVNGAVSGTQIVPAATAGFYRVRQ